MACKVNDEYAHLIDSPYGQAPDVSKSKAAASSAAAAGTSDSAAPSASRALMRTDGQQGRSSEAEAARKAREVRFMLSLLPDALQHHDCVVRLVFLVRVKHAENAFAPICALTHAA